MTPDQQILASRISEMVILDALIMKGVLTYADIQESIAAVRERIPRDLYIPIIAQILDVMEQTWQDAAPYQSPLPRPGEPQP